jgi:hypothetical protein
MWEWLYSMLGKLERVDMYESIEFYKNFFFLSTKQTLLFVSTNNNTLQDSSTIWVERKTRFIRYGNDDVLKELSISPV